MNISWLHESDANIARVGGKAMNLSRLARAGLPVPSGFCITIDAWRATLTKGAPDVIAKLCTHYQALDDVPTPMTDAQRAMRPSSSAQVRRAPVSISVKATRSGVSAARKPRWTASIT